ncbi:MAG TPA: hypothetical protein ENF51_00740 [Candidatus Aenigmarchaeota archaeon]|nr:hypothetical protein [Candidatus Aenigmarchaeota archaeon]
MRARYIPLLLAFLVLGCVQEGKPKVNASEEGVVITGVSVGISELMPEERTNLDLSLKNVGGSKAKDVRAILTGLGSMEATPIRNQLAELEEGGSDVFSWDLKAPRLEGFTTDVPFNLQVLVYYKYNSTAWADIAIVPSDYVEMPEVENGTSSGPIRISVEQSMKPVRTYKQVTQFSLRIDIENVGSGTISYLGEGWVENSTRNNKVEFLRVKVPDWWEVNGYEASAEGNWKVISLKGDEIPRLTGGKKATLFIPINVTQVDAPLVERIYVEVGYGYKIASEPITVVVKPLT